MEALIYILSWGSPVGLGLFFFFPLIGAGVFFWGLSRFAASSQDNEEAEV